MCAQNGPQGCACGLCLSPSPSPGRSCLCSQGTVRTRARRAGRPHNGTLAWDSSDAPHGAPGENRRAYTNSVKKLKVSVNILSFSAFLLNCIVCSAFHPIISHSWKTPGKTGETKTALVITGRKRRNKQRNVGLGKQISNMFFIVS